MLRAWYLLTISRLIIMLLIQSFFDFQLYICENWNPVKLKYFLQTIKLIRDKFEQEPKTLTYGIVNVCVSHYQMYTFVSTWPFAPWILIDMKCFNKLEILTKPQGSQDRVNGSWSCFEMNWSCFYCQIYLYIINSMKKKHCYRKILKFFPPSGLKWGPWNTYQTITSCILNLLSCSISTTFMLINQENSHMVEESMRFDTQLGLLLCNLSGCWALVQLGST